MASTTQYKYSDNCNNCSPVFDVSYVENLQNQIDRKVAKVSRTENEAKRNDLSCKINPQAFKNLNRYNNILEEIKFCNPCFSSYEFEDIVNLIKRELVS